MKVNPYHVFNIKHMFGSQLISILSNNQTPNMKQNGAIMKLHEMEVFLVTKLKLELEKFQELRIKR